MVLGSSPPDLSEASHGVLVNFFARGFAGAIRGWLSDVSATKADLIEAAAWWN